MKQEKAREKMASLFALLWIPNSIIPPLLIFDSVTSKQSVITFPDDGWQWLIHLESQANLSLLLHSEHIIYFFFWMM